LRTFLKKNMNKNYETVFILNPVLSDEQSKETVKKYIDLLKSNKASITSQETWGLKKLAYPIQNKKTGFFYLIQFQVEASDTLSNFETILKRDEKVMRFLTVSLDKNALEYAEKRRKRINESKKNDK